MLIETLACVNRLEMAKSKLDLLCRVAVWRFCGLLSGWWSHRYRRYTSRLAGLIRSVGLSLEPSALPINFLTANFRSAVWGFKPCVMF